MNTAELLDFGSKILKHNKIVSYRLDSEVILSNILNIPRESLLTKEYNVSENYDEPPEEIRQKVLDEISWKRHIEYYKCSNGKTLVIFSRHVNDEQHDKYLSNGYTLIYSMYELDQNTYMKYF